MPVSHLDTAAQLISAIAILIVVASLFLWVLSVGKLSKFLSRILRSASNTTELKFRDVVSEAVATQKWCPFARVPLGNAWGFTQPVSANRDPRYGGLSMANCLGSKCMAWRTIENFAKEIDDDLIAYHADDDVESKQRDDEQQSYGFCGLAR